MSNLGKMFALHPGQYASMTEEEKRDLTKQDQISESVFLCF